MDYGEAYQNRKNTIEYGREDPALRPAQPPLWGVEIG